MILYMLLPIADGKKIKTWHWLLIICDNKSTSGSTFISDSQHAINVWLDIMIYKYGHLKNKCYKITFKFIYKIPNVWYYKLCISEFLFFFNFYEMQNVLVSNLIFVSAQIIIVLQCRLFLLSCKILYFLLNVKIIIR